MKHAIADKNQGNKVDCRTNSCCCHNRRTFVNGLTDKSARIKKERSLRTLCYESKQK